MTQISLQAIQWVGSSQKDLKEFPEDVRGIMGYALYLAQTGGKHQSARPLKGFGGAKVLEISDDYDGDTYRAVYTIKFGDTVYVLHAFQKKSKKGIATPQQDIKLIQERLKRAQEHYENFKSK
ncbi:type II toxin-antitoxin system RelE/ParE family toxin [Microcoleus sp. herbarium5]|uniref:type II toxin-antitoxin system RelE/ParE family toxin n=1 Tax=Microcoleus sp. herbarium5 TaxID=3055434 RepID=UPI002FCEBE81